MADRKVTPQVFVELTIEVPSRSSWSPDETMANIEKFAGRETVQDILTTLRVKYPNIRIAKDPVVRAVVMEAK